MSAADSVLNTAARRVVNVVFDLTGWESWEFSVDRRAREESDLWLCFLLFQEVWFSYRLKILEWNRKGESLSVVAFKK